VKITLFDPLGYPVNELISLLITQNGGAQQPSCAQQMFPFAIMLLIFYFLLIRPQQKQEQERQSMLSRLKKGDSVITSGGLIGTIHSVQTKEITVEIADKVKVRVSREDVDLYE
jgi:preprotein translocase subunit YajC